MRTTFTAAAMWLMAIIVGADEPSGKLVFKGMGFSIAPLAESQEGPVQALVMSMPSFGGFAANVSVNLQPYVGSLDGYARISRAQIKEGGFKLLEERKIDKATIVFEYNGSVPGRTRHCYARAIQQGDIVYIITGTATEDQWAKLSEKLKACVDSFEPLPTEPETAK
jgi:hypothetical protein